LGVATGWRLPGKEEGFGFYVERLAAKEYQLQQPSSCPMKKQHSSSGIVLGSLGRTDAFRVGVANIIKGKYRILWQRRLPALFSTSVQK
jgi:hypothetical protein